MTGSRDETIAKGCKLVFSLNLSGSNASLPSDLSGKDEINIVMQCSVSLVATLAGLQRLEITMVSLQLLDSRIGRI